MNYWLNLFTGTTWEEFRKAGATITGFNGRNHRIATEIEAGDIFLCYVTGVMRWVGALEVIAPTNDMNPIWKDADYPIRFKVQPLILLEPTEGIPADELEGRVSFYSGPQGKSKFTGFVRGSPRLFKDSQDGQLILDLLRQAEQHPTVRLVDPKKLARKPYNLFKAERLRGSTSIPVQVTVPEPEEFAEQVEPQTIAPEVVEQSATEHTEIQFYLLSLGAEMGLDVWVARNDRSRKWNGQTLSMLPHMVSELPTQFNEATTRTVELIDVLWLRGNSIEAAFEIESTTSIYSGLLRMSDLISLQPNLTINLFLVAPDERRSKVQQEMLRPTFEMREKPLSRVCGFISFSTLREKVEGIRKLGIARSLKPDFLEGVAEYFGEEKS